MAETITTRTAPDLLARAETLVGSAHDDLLATGKVPSIELEPGESIDRYLILARIGAGGMGVVYAAYDPELDRKVALKLLRTHEVDGDDTRRRLLREAQAMARLQHPNVIAVYDCGTIGEQVWVAMEFVAGQTFDAWRAASPRGWREVLEVLCAAGRGLVAAHEAALVHRDVKPDNIMVGDDGRVRLMDFGLARSGDAPGRVAAPSTLKSSHDSLHLDLTHVGAVLGTPLYMAPEQFAGVPADARSDQFGWCVTCWEALHGERPFGGDDLLTLAAAVTRGELRVPSHSPAPRWLRRLLARGLHPDPDRRFASMTDLLAEITRAQARPRRLVAGSALGLGFAALIGFMGANQVESTRAEAACQAASAALDPAWNPATRAQLAAAFTAASPELGPIAAARTSAWIDQLAATWSAHRRDLCRETTIHRSRAPELAVPILACLDERQLDLEVTLELLAAPDPEVVQHAAHLVSGLAPADTCFTEMKWSPAALAPEDPVQRARGVALRRRLIRASALEDAGKFTAGLTAAHDVLHAATLEGRSELRAAAQMRVGNLHDRRGAYAEAEHALEQAVWLAAQDGHDETVAEAASMLAFTVGLHRGRHDDALRWARLSQAALQRAGAETSLRAARLHSVFGTLHRLRGDLDLAHEHAGKALALREALLGQEHPDVARALNTLGNVDLARGELDQALAHHTRALAIRERVYGPENYDVATSLRNLGDTRRVRGELTLALAHHSEALRLREHLLGAGHPSVAESLVDLGRTQQALGDLVAANLSLERAIVTHEHLHATPQALADALLHAGEVALALGHAPDALTHLERARALAGSGDPPFPARAAILTALARRARPANTPRQAPDRPGSWTRGPDAQRRLEVVVQVADITADGIGRRTLERVAALAVPSSMLATSLGVLLAAIPAAPPTPPPDPSAGFRRRAPYVQVSPGILAFDVTYPPLRYYAWGVEAGISSPFRRTGLLTLGGFFEHLFYRDQPRFRDDEGIPDHHLLRAGPELRVGASNRRVFGYGLLRAGLDLYVDPRPHGQISPLFLASIGPGMQAMFAERFILGAEPAMDLHVQRDGVGWLFRARILLGVLF